MRMRLRIHESEMSLAIGILIQVILLPLLCWGGTGYTLAFLTTTTFKRCMLHVPDTP